ncbi:MAG: S8 family serine peptidase, partial [Acidobacteriota bacterium]
MSIASRPDLRIEPLFKVPTDLLDALRRTGERRTGVALADLSQFFVLHLGGSSADDALSKGLPEDLLAEILASDAVETVYHQRRLALPMDIPPITPNFESGVGPGQGYRGPAPLGIDVNAAWTRGLRGNGVTVVDVENSWNLDHEDLHHLTTQVDPTAILGPGTWSPLTRHIDHGTATLGVLASGDNGYGTTGLVPDATIRVLPVSDVTDPTWNGAYSVVLATLHMDAGDVLLIEAQTEIRPGTNLHLPFEVGPAEYAAVAQAHALGIHVIQPAGNSTAGLDLDTHGSVTNMGTAPSLFDRYVRDSGAVLVGGGRSTLTAGKHTRYPNSNYGSRVDTFAWGEDVVSLGYGPRFLSTPFCRNRINPFPQTLDQNQHYTYCYNGTSSAGAVVAGAAAILEQKHRADFGQPFAPKELRNLLSLGSPSTDDIGH